MSWLKRHARLVGGVSAATVLVVALLLVAIGWVGADRTIHPEPEEDVPTLAEHPLPVQRVEFASKDGTRLRGFWLPAAADASRAGTVVLLHGYGGQKEEMLPQAEYLWAAGYNVLMFDFRASGESDGDAVTVGAFEQEDALGALDYLASRGDVEMRRVGFQGVSMGAAVAVMAGARDGRVAGFVLEAPFQDVPSIIGTQYKHQVGLPQFPFAPITVFILERRLGVDAADISPLKAIPKLAGRPLLLIEDAEDIHVLPSNQRALLAAAGEPKELWSVPGAGHGEGHDVAKDEYERRVLAFWSSALKAR